jgi:hypothetical protein
MATNFTGHSQMIAKTLPNLDLLQELFLVDKTSPSGLFWKNPRSKKLKPGDVAGYKNKRGYWLVGINNPTPKAYLVHRIVWFLSTKEDPQEYLIDHIDQNPSNNTTTNLRLSTHKTNKLNRLKPKNKKAKSKYKGVCFEAKTNKWYARINYQSKKYYLGMFNNELDAAKAYDQKAKSFNCPFVSINFPNE